MKCDRDEAGLLIFKFLFCFPWTFSLPEHGKEAMKLMPWARCSEFLCFLLNCNSTLFCWLAKNVRIQKLSPKNETLHTKDSIPAALAEFLGEAPSAAALRGGPAAFAEAAEAARSASPGDTPRSDAPPAPPGAEDGERPPTPTPQEFQVPEVKVPEVKEVIVHQTVRFEVPKGEVSEVGEVREGSSLEASRERIPSKLTPAEATRIAALRAKGLLKDGNESSAVPTAPPPKPAGFETEDLFYVEGAGWCDIYGRTVGHADFGSSPAQSRRSSDHASSPSRSMAGSPRPPVSKGIKASRKAQQDAWDAIPGI